METTQFQIQLFSKVNENTVENEEDLIVTFNDETLKKELNKVALKGLQAFVSSYNKNSITAMEESYQFVSAMGETYDVAKSLCGFETQKNMSTVDLISGITTQVANLKKIENSLSSVLGDVNPKAGIITSVIGFSGAYLATLDGITPEEKAELVKSGIDLIGEGAKLLFKVMLPGASLAIDVGIDMTVALAKGIYETVNSLNGANISGNFSKDYYDELSDVESSMSEVLEKYKLRVGTVSDDYVKNTVSGAIINTFAGNDTITNQPDTIADKATKVKINGGVGNDLIITSWGSDKSVINGDLGNDTVKNYSDNVSISGGGGNDLIRNDGGSTLIKGGAGNDSVENYGDNVSVNSGEGDDSVKNYGDNVLVNGDAGNNLLKNYGSNVTINGSNEKNVIINTSQLENYDYEYGFYLDRSDSRFVTNGSRDSVNTYGTLTYVNSYDVIMNGGSDNDFLFNNNSFTTIKGYEGNDAIVNESGLGWVCILFPLSGYSLSTCDFRYVNPTRFGDHVIIDSGIGNDSISNNGVFTSINASDGDDVIENGIFDNNIDISIDGITDDLVFNFSESIVGSYDRRMDRKNYAFSSHYRGDISVIEGGTGNDTIKNFGSYVTVNGGDGDDVIINRSRSGNLHYEVSKSSGEQSSHYFSGEYYVISEENLNYSSPYISNFSNNHNFSNQYLEYDRDRIKLENYFSGSTSVFIENRDVINGGAGNDSISNTGGYTTVNGGDGDDSIVNDGVYVTVDGGEGNDFIASSSNWVTMNGGNGEDYLFNTKDVVSISGGAGNDYIENKDYVRYVTINGGTGNDTIYFHSYSENVLQYFNGDGKDVVYGLTVDDTLQISGSSYSTNISGNDVIVKVGDGSLTLKNVANLGSSLNIVGTFSGDTIGENISNSNANTVVNGTNDSDSIYNLANNVTIYSGNGNDTIYSYIGDFLYIDSGDGDDSLANALLGTSLTINAGKGNDTIEAGCYNSNINGGANDDHIIVVGCENFIDGGDGNDRISIEGEFLYAKDTVKGGKGNDTIYGDSFKIYGSLYQYVNGDGNDIIYNFKSNDTIQITSGNYSTIVSGNDFILSVGNGSVTLKNVLENSYNKIHIKDSSGKISIYNDWKIMSGTSANDTLENFSESIAVYGYEGNDKIKNHQNYVTILSGVGNDSIYNNGYYSVIDAGDGKDTINHFFSSYSSIDSGKDNDYIVIGNSNNVKINAGSGKDSIVSEIYQFYESTVDGGLDDDYISVSGDAHLINGGLGNDSIYGTYYNSSISGGNGNDVISLDGESSLNIIQYENNDGNDVVYGIKSGDTLQITGSKYSTVKSCLDLKVSAGNGSILLKDAANIAVKIVGTIESGSTTNETLQTGISVKSSVLTASTAFKGNRINLADYEATKVNASALTQNVTIIGSSVSNSIKGGKGADIISGVNGKNTISGGTGNDSVLGGADNDKLLGEAGNDSLNGGTGNDTLTGGAGQDIFIYSGGNDLITDYKANEDKIKIGTITNSTVKGSDVILTTGNGNLTIKGAKDKVVMFVDNSGKTTEKIFFGNISYSPLSNGLTYDTKRVVLTASNKFSGNKLDLSEYLSTVEKVNVSALSKGINVVGNTANNSVKGSSGADTISGGAGKDTILGGNGNDIINGGTDNDILKGDVGNDTLNGGTGNNTLTGGAGNDVFVYGGGNDVITDYFTGQNTIKLESGTITSATVKGSDVVLNTSNGSITVKNGKGKKITVTDGNGNTTTEYYGLMNYNADKTALTLSSAFSASLKSEDYATSVKKIDASSVSKSINVSGNSQNNTIIGSGKAETIYGGSGNDSIMGNAGNDKLFGETGEDTLSGGKGNDTLTGGDGNDVFFYANGEGNDVIADFTAGQDSISLTSGTVANASLKSSDMVFKVGSGTLTVKNAKNKEISIGDSIYYNNLIYDTNKTSVTLGAGFSGSLKSSDYASTIKTINASGLTKSTNIVGNSQNNTIIGSSKAETVYGGSGNDSIIGNAGNDKLYGDAGNDTLLGGDGNDSLYGGLGNNTLTGGKGKDVFAYEGGNDTITDYTTGQDTIKITSGSITKTSYSGNNVIFTVGSGSITVLNGKGKKIAITDSNKKTTTLTYNQDVSYMASKTASNARWFTADDNNFMTDEFTLDSVADISETNYSVGQMEYVENNAEFTTGDSLVLASTFDDK